jgi:hypothetical protein
METLIELYVTEGEGSIDDVFSDIPLKNKKFPDGWKDVDNFMMDEQIVLKEHGARLLLLLAYVMITNVLDDKSNDTQM